MPIRTGSIAPSRGRRLGFAGAVFVSAALVIVGLGEILSFGVAGWLDPVSLERFHPGGEIHRFHGLVHAMVAWIMALCVLVQLVRPWRTIAPAIFGLVVLGIYTTMDVLSGMFDPLEAVGIVAFAFMVWLHPGRESASVEPVRKSVVGLSAPLVVGGVAFAVLGMAEQVSSPAMDPHGVIGHYGDMAAAALAIALGCLIGSTALAGSSMVAALAVGGSVFSGLASVAYADSPSSPGVLIGASIILAAVLYGLPVFAGGLPHRIERTSSPA